MKKAEADKLVKKIKIAVKNNAIVEEYGCFSKRMSQSDKLGYDWQSTYLGDVLLRREYVAQDNPRGVSADTAILYEDDVQLINGGFYRWPDGTIKVYMDGEWTEW